VFPRFPPDLHRKFKNVFGISITVSYWDRLLGFDIVKFDTEIVKPNDDESMKNAVLRQWGQEGVDLLQRLLDWERGTFGVVEDD